MEPSHSNGNGTTNGNGATPDFSSLHPRIQSMAWQHVATGTYTCPGCGRDYPSVGAECRRCGLANVLVNIGLVEAKC